MPIMNRPISITALSALLLTAAATLALPVPGGTQTNPRATPPITQTAEGGIRMGSATAQAALVEYVSYTCSHCATYDAQSYDTLRTTYVARGTTSVEVRPLVRDIIDLASATLARCGTPARFFERHHALMARQATTLAAADAASSAWSAVPGPQRLARVATDTGLIAAVAPLGVSGAQAAACLADTAAIDRIIAVAQGSAALGIRGTPSFLINGELQAGTHSWTALRPRLDAALVAR
jgi:protein-disulfide isomerase